MQYLLFERRGETQRTPPDPEFPKEYLEDPSLEVAVAVGHRKRAGEPWGRYVVLLVVAEPKSRGA